MIRDDIEQSIPRRFESCVETGPGRIAVDDGHRQWSYAELDRRANRIANAILDRCGPGNEPVALLYDHGAPLIAAVLGTLKAGKIYVALDPADGVSRFDTTLVTAHPQLVVADQANSARAIAVPNVGGRTLIDGRDTAGFQDHQPDVNLTPDTLAYIFFTSGSTGAPKGVVDNHRNVLHNILRYTTNLGIGREDRLTLLQSCAFSGSVSSLFCALLNGASSYPFDLRRLGTSPLADWIDANQVTVYHSVPSVFRRITKSATRFPSVRVVRLEGDTASPADVALFRERFSDDCLLAIGLGATETGLSCQHIVGGVHGFPADSVSVGIPPLDVAVSIVGEDGERVSHGRPGEIVVHSRYLAVGYWGRPDLTSKVFHESDDGSRAYRTGDRGAIQEGGRVDYLGRIDHRLKIRGNAVEPAVVERAILDTGFTRESVVGGRMDAWGEQRLVAWIVSNGQLRAVNLRASLSAVLPSYMVPSVFVQIDAMPLSDNGKLDRQALPNPSSFADGPGREIIAPRNAGEFQLMRLWQTTLGNRGVSVTDDFFESGGDSLSAVQLAIEIEEKFGRPFKPSDLFANPTISALAIALANWENRGSVSPIVCLQHRGKETAFFCVHPGDGDCLVYRRLAAHMAPERPFYAFHAVLPPEGEAHATEIHEIAKLYAECVREIQPHGPYLIGGYCYGSLVALEIARQLSLSGSESCSLVCFDTDGEDRLVGSTADSVAIHFRRLRRLRWHAKLRYVAERASFRRDRMGVQVMAAASAVLSLAGVTPPDNFRKAQLRNARFRGAQRHRPEPWNGRVIYFHPEGRAYVDPAKYWSKLAPDGVEFVTVSGDGSAMFEEPHVTEVATQLRALLATPNDSQRRILKTAAGSRILAAPATPI